MMTEELRKIIWSYPEDDKLFGKKMSKYLSRSDEPCICGSKKLYKHCHGE